MKRRQSSLTAVMAVVGLSALGLAALRSGSVAWFKASYAVTLLALILAVIAAWYRLGGRRASWIGFAVFGWAYFLTGFVFMREPALIVDIPLPGPSFPTAALTDQLVDVLVPQPVFRQRDMFSPWYAHERAREATLGVEHLALAWACGIVGGAIGRCIPWFRQPSGRGSEQGHSLEPA